MTSRQGLPPKPKININEFRNADGSIRIRKVTSLAGPPQLPERPRPEIEANGAMRNDDCSPVHHGAPAKEDFSGRISLQKSTNALKSAISFEFDHSDNSSSRFDASPLPRRPHSSSLPKLAPSERDTREPSPGAYATSSQKKSHDLPASQRDNIELFESSSQPPSQVPSLSPSRSSSVTTISSQSSLLAQTRHAQHEIVLKIHEVDHRPPPSVPTKFLSAKMRKLLSADSRYVCITTGYKVLLYSWRSASLLWEQKFHTNTALIVSQSNTVWLATNSGSLKVVGLNSGGTEHILEKGHVKPVTFLGSTTRGNVISLSAEDGKVNIWPRSLPNDVPPGDIYPEHTFRVMGKCYMVGCSDDLMWTAREVQVDAYSLRGGAVHQVSTALKKRGVSLGIVTSVATYGGLAFFGQNDGFITVFDGSMFLGSINGGIHTITALAAPTSTELWAGTRSGEILVFTLLIGHDQAELMQLSASLKRQWKAHKTAVVTLQEAEAKAAMLSVARGGEVKGWNSTPTSILPPTPKVSQSYNVQVLTWNVDASHPDSIDPDWIVGPISRSNIAPDVVVIGLQEVVELENKSQAALKMLMAGDAELSGEYDSWKSCLERWMAPLGLHLMAIKPLVGLVSCLFVRGPLVSYVSKVEARVIKTGMGGTYGNKGGVIITLCIGSMSFCFINCHLAAGHTSIIQRNKDADQIVLSSSHLDYDACFFFGDTNYRINAAREQAEGLIKTQNWERLRQLDQLLSQIAKNPSFSLGKFQEGRIDFAPTYKFDRGTNRYDTSDKKRIPSWCDRVLFRGNSIRVDEYKSLETRTSDHNAVFGTFSVPVLQK